jgi:N-acetylmuramoyl-L-alanine amidase
MGYPLHAPRLRIFPRKPTALPWFRTGAVPLRRSRGRSISLIRIHCTHCMDHTFFSHCEYTPGMRVPLVCVIVLFASLSFAATPGTPAPRTGDEIVVCGQFFHTGTPIVLWLDPGGYDAYRMDMKKSPIIPGAPPVPEARPLTRPAYGVRSSPLTDAEVEQVRGGNWTLPELQQKVDQFVLHYDVCGTSRECFRVLHTRGLSVHFMCDIDGTIYQTIDLKDETWHATSSNGRSIGVEIANMGAYPISASPLPLMEWYSRDARTHQTRITLPARFGDGGVRTPNFIGHPSRPDLITANIQGEIYRQYDFTPQQYNALAHLAATLCTVFPKIQPDYPRLKMSLGQPTTAASTRPAPSDLTVRPGAIAEIEQPGALIPHALSPGQLDEYQGILGHYHVQLDKQDPGPAFQWDNFITETRTLMSPAARAANLRYRHQPARFIASPPPKPATTIATTRPS